VLVANATELRIVADEVREFSALLNKIAAGKPSDPIVKSGNSEQLTQNQTRVVEAQRLIEIGR
jgi:hypothetical protein